MTESAPFTPDLSTAFARLVGIAAPGIAAVQSHRSRVGHARAAENEPKVITLSCDGTLTRTYGANKPADPEPLQKTGVVVNLDEQTVFFLGYVVPIYDVDEASINFGARQIVDYGFSVAITGNIDRVTGRMDVTTVTVRPDEAQRS